MASSTDYAPRFGWKPALRDIRDGALATVRGVVTFSGCAALIAVGAVAIQPEWRQAALEAIPSPLALMQTAEAHWVEPLEEQPVTLSPAAAIVDPREQHVAQYLVRRYRVADDAVKMLVSAAFDVGRERKLDPLLILSVMAIESSFNPFAQSPVGAQGLMQVMTRVHLERFEPHGGEKAALDPITNIKVGSDILYELISRGGSIERGLQLYVGAGNLPDDGGYAAKVLGERARLEMAAAGKVGAAVAAAIRPAAPPPPPVQPLELGAPVVHTGGTPAEADATAVDHSV